MVRDIVGNMERGFLMWSERTTPGLLDCDCSRYDSCSFFTVIKRKEFDYEQWIDEKNKIKENRSQREKQSKRLFLSIGLISQRFWVQIPASPFFL